MNTEDTPDNEPPTTAATQAPRRPYLRIFGAVLLLGLSLFAVVAILAQHYVNYGRWAYQGPYPIIWGANLHKMGDRQRAIIFSQFYETVPERVRTAQVDVRSLFPPHDATTDRDHESSARMAALAMVVSCLMAVLAIFLLQRRFSLATLLFFTLLIGLLASLPFLLDRRDFEYGAIECQLTHRTEGFSLDRERLLTSLAPDLVAKRTPSWLLNQLTHDGQFAVEAVRWSLDQIPQHLFTFDNDAMLEVHFLKGTDTSTRERCLEWYATFLGLVMAEAYRKKGYVDIRGEMDFVGLNPKPLIKQAQKGWADSHGKPPSLGRTFGPNDPLFEFTDQPIRPEGQSEHKPL